MPPLPPRSEYTTGEEALVTSLRTLDVQGLAELGTHAQLISDRLPLLVANLPPGLNLVTALDQVLARFQAGEGL